MPTRFKVHCSAYPHFITSTTTYWLPIFSKDAYFDILVQSFRYCIENKGLVLHDYVFMPNHFHVICSMAAGDLADVIRDIKGFTSKQIAVLLKSDGRSKWLYALEWAGGDETDVKVWQDGFHPELIHSLAFYEQKRRYVYENPVRAGYVEDMLDWRYSSARYWYTEGESVLPLEAIDW